MMFLKLFIENYNDLRALPVYPVFEDKKPKRPGEKLVRRKIALRPLD